ncbi:MAG: trimethylamine methyltransferase family protein [Clostridiales bacterium]|jgi:trimethylamine--corrinoid protein Co-methyltransferase|nr:trimethylamine methyltransferase family protein [Clostridiales bacterium]
MKKIRSSIEVLSADEIEAIHHAALRILESTGMGAPNAEVLRRCAKAGAVVDYSDCTVKIPVPLMEEFLTEQRTHVPVQEDPLQASKLYGCISTQVFVTDFMTSSRRPGTLDDIKKCAALADKLPFISAANAAVVPGDVDARVTDVYSFNLLYKYQKKAGGTYVLTPKTARFIMDMAECMGRKEGYLFESVCPLRFRPETLEMGLLFADRGHGLWIAPMVVGGTAAPMSLAGTVTLICAEVLGSQFFVRAISGKPVAFFAHGSHTSDPRTTLCSFGSPNQALIGVAAAQMAKFYGVPSGSNSALSDALELSFQCGFEKALSGLMSVLAGSCSIGCQGIAGADQGFSFEQLLVDNEWLSAVNYVLDGFEADEDAIAEELIKEVGIGGNFLAEEHTVRYLRQNWWDSRLFGRQGFDRWKEAGAKGLLQSAHAMVEEMTSGYKRLESVIDGAKADALDLLLRQACDEILSE